MTRVRGRPASDAGSEGAAADVTGAPVASGHAEVIPPSSVAEMGDELAVRPPAALGGAAGKTRNGETTRLVFHRAGKADEGPAAIKAPSWNSPRSGDFREETGNGGGALRDYGPRL